MMPMPATSTDPDMSLADNAAAIYADRSCSLLLAGDADTPQTDERAAKSKMQHAWCNAVPAVPTIQRAAQAAVITRPPATTLHVPLGHALGAGPPSLAAAYLEAEQRTATMRRSHIETGCMARPAAAKLCGSTSHTSPTQPPVLSLPTMPAALSATKQRLARRVTCCFR